MATTHLTPPESACAAPEATPATGLLTVQQVAQELMVSVDTIRRLNVTKKLRVVRIRRRVLIRRSELERFLAVNEK